MQFVRGTWAFGWKNQWLPDYYNKVIGIQEHSVPAFIVIPGQACNA